MKPIHFNSRRCAGRARLAGGVALCLVALAAVGCDTLDRALEVEAPELIPAERTNDPATASLLIEGTLADFDCAFGSYIVIGGLVTDEFVEASALANRWPYDRRDVGSSEPRYGTFTCQGLGVYVPLSTARFTADDVLNKLEGWTDEQVDDRTSLISIAAAYSGYSHVLLGEGFCSGVLLDSTLAPGGEVPPEALFERAAERFTRAIAAAQSAGNDTILSMAYVGRARALLNLGRYADAAADARLVPAGFVVNATASNTSTRRQNRVYVQNQLFDIVSVGPEYRGLSFGGVADPRVDVVETDDVGLDGVTVIWAQTKYTSESSSMPIATWEEAQLIIAEAELQDGDLVAAVEAINRLHEGAGLPPFSSTNSAEIMQHLIEERRRELFVESHRLYDVNRFGIALDPPPGTQYPKSGLYGDTKCLPLPDIERANNPNI